MTKIIGIKELQTKTRHIREQVAKGTHYVVVWRSTPIFEIRPLNNFEFSADLANAGTYTDDFLQRMKEAETDVNNGKTLTHENEKNFLKSLK